MAVGAKQKAKSNKTVFEKAGSKRKREEPVTTTKKRGKSTPKPQPKPQVTGGKRGRERDSYKEYKAQPARKYIRENKVHEDDIKVKFNHKKGTEMYVAPWITQLIAAGDYETLQNEFAGKTISDMYATPDNKNAAKVSNEDFIAFRDFLVHSAKAVASMRATSYNDEQIRTQCEKLDKFKANLDKGLYGVNFQEVQDALGILLHCYQEKRAKVDTVEEVELGADQKSFQNKVAKDILEDRMKTEQMEAEAEAAKTYADLAKQAEEECVTHKRKFESIQTEKDQAETIENYEQRKIRKQDLEDLAAQESNAYMTSSCKRDNYTRLHGFSARLVQHMRDEEQKGSSARNGRQMVENILKHSAKVLNGAVKNSQKSKGITKETINKLKKLMPELNEGLQKMAKEYNENLPDLAKENRERDTLSSEIKQLNEQINSVDGVILDDEEDIAAIKELEKQNVQKRVSEGVQASNTVLRDKRQKVTERRDANLRQKRELESKKRAAEAQLTRLNMKRNEGIKMQEQAATINEQLHTFDELEKNTSARSDDIDIDTFNEINSVAENIHTIAEMNRQGNATINLTFAPSTIEENRTLEHVRLQTKLMQYLDDKISELKFWQERINEHNARLHELVNKGDPAAFAENEALWKAQQEYSAREKWLITYVQEETQKNSGALIPASTVKEVIDDKLSTAVVPGGYGNTRVSVPAADRIIKIIPSAAQVSMNLTLANRDKGFSFGRGAKAPEWGSLKRKSTDRGIKGGYLVGKRPDPLIDLEFWKKLYRKTK